MYKLRVVVEEIRGFCDLPVTVGDHFEVDGSRLLIPPGKHVCIWALQALMPLITVKQRNVAETNDWTPNTCRMICPDPNGMVIYRIDRIDGPGTDVPRRLLVTAAHCTGCRRCELACSFFHETQYAPEMSRIRVTKDDARGQDTPTACRQCGTARCVEACPQGALSKNATTQAVVLDKSLCSRCGMCQKACPFGAIRLGPEGHPLICDLCGGEPRCVEACPTGAINFGRAGEALKPPRFAQPGKSGPFEPTAGENDAK